MKKVYIIISLLLMAFVFVACAAPVALDGTLETPVAPETTAQQPVATVAPPKLIKVSGLQAISAHLEQQAASEGFLISEEGDKEIQFDVQPINQSAFYTEFMESATKYPAHEYPVRFIAVFETKEGLYGVYQSYVEKGMVFPKETLFVSDGVAPVDTFLKLLSKYPAGTIDAVICESAELGKIVYESLKQEDRNDMEVFVCDYSEDLFALHQNDPKLMSIVVGPDKEYAVEAFKSELQNIQNNTVISLPLKILIVA